MNLQKLLSLRERQRRVISIQLGKFEGDLTESEKTELLNIIKKKADIMKRLNEKIINHTETSDIETELVTSEEYSIDLDLKLRKLRDIVFTSTPPTSDPAGMSQRGPHVTNNASSESTEVYTGVINSDNCIHSGRSEVNPQVSTFSNNSSVSSSSHKLPKLRLPEFGGDITHWQTFWDSYESAVHINQTLTDVQKFNYLRSLLYGNAASAIAGFPLTNGNYKTAVELLQKRFGKSHKIRNSYMQSLLDLPKSNSNVESARDFHDKMETFIRGLESLGQFENSYGDLLVPILLEKLPGELRRNMARGQGGDVCWTLPNLRSSIEREINIMEAGQSHREQPYLPTASFYTRTGNARPQQHERTVNKIQECAFCGKQHPAVNCNKIKTEQERLDIVKTKGFCYNCLMRHRVSTCKSNKRCRHCSRKHHTSLCDKHSIITDTLNPNAAPYQNSTSGATEKRPATILHSNGPTRIDRAIKNSNWTCQFAKLPL